MKIFPHSLLCSLLVFALCPARILAQLPQSLMQRMSDGFKKLRVLSSADAELAYRAAIEAGSTGDTAMARGIATVVVEAIVRPGLGQPSNGESIEESDLELVKKWADVVLNYSEPSARAEWSDYNLLRNLRHRHTKTLYRDLAFLRSYRPAFENDAAFKARQSKRGTLTKRIWQTAVTDDWETINKLTTDIDDQMKELTRQVRPGNIGLRSMHVAELSVLLNALPPASVMIDIVRYNKFHSRKDSSGLPIKTPSYVAFLFKHAKAHIAGSHRPDSKGFVVSRIEIGRCRDVDPLISAWVKAVESGRDDASLRDRTSRKVWHPIAEHLPDDATTMFIVTDGLIHRLPWSALRSRDGRPVVERLEVAMLPFTDFLLQSTREGPIDSLGGASTANDPMHTFLGVSANLNELPHGSVVSKLINESFPRDQVRIDSGPDVTRQRLFSDLRQAKVAHIALHGTFQASALRTLQATGGYQSMAPQHYPLFSALLLPISANAEISRYLSGYELAELDLARLKLAVIAACDSDLGEPVASEGQFSITRAFHLAGCRDVVSALWSVDDAVTAIVMTAFHKQLLLGKGPREALRNVQLQAYRGTLRFPPESLTRNPLRPNRKRRTSNRRTDTVTSNTTRIPTRLWASFRLTGPGNRCPYDVLPNQTKQQTANSRPHFRAINAKYSSILSYADSKAKWPTTTDPDWKQPAPSGLPLNRRKGIFGTDDGKPPNVMLYKNNMLPSCFHLRFRGTVRSPLKGVAFGICTRENQFTGTRRVISLEFPTHTPFHSKLPGLSFISEDRLSYLDVRSQRDIKLQGEFCGDIVRDRLGNTVTERSSINERPVVRRHERLHSFLLIDGRVVDYSQQSVNLSSRVGNFFISFPRGNETGLEMSTLEVSRMPRGFDFVPTVSEESEAEAISVTEIFEKHLKPIMESRPRFGQPTRKQ